MISTDSEELRFWDVPTRTARPFDALRKTSGWALHPDGRTLFGSESVGYGAVRLVGIDLVTGTVGPALKANVGATEEKPFVSYGRARVAPDGTVTVGAQIWAEEYYEDDVEVRWDPRTGKAEVRAWTDPEAAAPGLAVGRGETVWRVEWSEDRKVAAGPVYRKKDGVHPSDQPKAGFAAWDVKTGREQFRAPADGLVAAALSADGRRVVAVYRDRMAVWDVAAGREAKVFRLPPLDGEWRHVLAVTADGTRAFTAHGFGTILVWELGGR